VTLVAGYAGSLATEALRDRRAAEREERRHTAERAGVIENRRAEFQREALLALQDAGARLARGIGATHHFDLMTYRTSGGAWGRTSLPDDLNRNEHEAIVDFNKYMVRGLDGSTRAVSLTFLESAGGVAVANSEADAQQSMRLFSKAYGRFQDLVGEQLRSLY
jgi:hypothetical protein